MSLTGYNVFVQERYNKLKKRNLDMDFSDIASKLGDQWNELSLAQKDKYARKAEKLNEKEQKKREPRKEPKQTKPKTSRCKK